MVMQTYYIKRLLDALSWLVETSQLSNQKSRMQQTVDACRLCISNL